MFYFNVYVKKQTDSFYDLRIDKKYKIEIIQQFSLEEGESIKEYWENNVQILASKNNTITYQYIEDISILDDQKNNLLIQECKMNECPKYNFYQVNQEEEYLRYKKEMDNVTIILKEYTNHLELIFMCKYKGLFYSKNFINIYYNIYK
tara:strand:- start:193 stop:636 length:444 start_codon:yes stop_codon:yes gene_type:complete